MILMLRPAGGGETIEGWWAGVKAAGFGGHPHATTTETDDAQRFAGEPSANRHATLEAAGSHRPIGNRDGTGGSDEQAKR